VLCDEFGDAVHQSDQGIGIHGDREAIISTPVRDVVRQWSDVVRLAQTAEEFVAAAEEALRAGPSDSRVKRGIELASAVPGKRQWRGCRD